MIGVLKKIWDFAGEEQDNIRKSMILGFFYAVFHICPRPSRSSYEQRK